MPSGEAKEWHRRRGYAPTPLLERIMARVVKTTAGCWEWQGPRLPAGYGTVGRGPKNSGRILTHRAVYEASHGPIPKGFQIDHLCFNTPCCNPAHLEAVTAKENRRRQADRSRRVTHAA